MLQAIWILASAGVVAALAWTHYKNVAPDRMQTLNAAVLQWQALLPAARGSR